MNVKGNSVYLIKKFIVEKYGHDYYDKIIQDAVNKEVLASPIISSEWYDIQVKDELCQKFFANVTKEEFKECSRYEVNQQVRGLIKFIISKMSIEFLVNNLQMIWNKHFSGGKIVGLIEENKIYIDLSEFPGSEPFMFHIETYIKTMFEIVKKKMYISEREKIDDSTWKIVLR